MPGFSFHQTNKKKLYKKRPRGKMSLFHTKKLRNFIDKAIYLVGIFTLILTIPQVWTIWVGQNASGVSMVSWVSYMVAAIFWLFYGFVHRQKPIVMIYVSWIALDVFIIAGIFIFS